MKSGGFFISLCSDSPDVTRFDEDDPRHHRNDDHTENTLLNTVKSNDKTPSMTNDKMNDDEDITLICTSSDQEEEEEEEETELFTFDDISCGDQDHQMKQSKTPQEPNYELISSLMNIDDTMQLGDIFSRYNMLYEHLCKRECSAPIFGEHWNNLYQLFFSWDGDTVPMGIDKKIMELLNKYEIKSC